MRERVGHEAVPSFGVRRLENIRLCRKEIVQHEQDWNVSSECLKMDKEAVSSKVEGLHSRQHPSAREFSTRFLNCSSRLSSFSLPLRKNVLQTRSHSVRISRTTVRSPSSTSRLRSSSASCLAFLEAVFLEGEKIELVEATDAMVVVESSLPRRVVANEGRLSPREGNSENAAEGEVAVDDDAGDGRGGSESVNG